MILSERLKTVAAAVTSGHRVADIGTDHGYVPVYLVKNNICPAAFAMDINAGPLARARAHIRQEGLEKQIAVRQSDGLKELHPDEVDSIVIAGMGAELICRILKGSPEFMDSGKELILQPQSEWFKVRHFLIDHHYGIMQEWFLKEEGKYYLVIKALRNESLHIPKDSQSEIYYRYGWDLIRKQDPVLTEYLEKEYSKRQEILKKMELLGRKQLPRYEEIRQEAEEIKQLIPDSGAGR